MSGYPPGADTPDAPWNAEDADQETIDKAKAEFYVANRERARQKALTQDLVEAIAQAAENIATGYLDELAGGEFAAGAAKSAITKALHPYLVGHLHDWWEVEERERFGAERLVR